MCSVVRFGGGCIGLLLSLTSSAEAGSPHREVTSFAHSQSVAANERVYVVGNHADVGNWQPIDAVKLRNAGGNNWEGDIGIQAGTALEYKYIVRDHDPGPYCDTNNVTWPGGANQMLNIPAQPISPYTGKTVFYHTSWTQAFFLFSTDGVNFTDAQMNAIGPGRSAGEFLYKVSGIADAGEPIQFVMHDGAGTFDHAPYAGYGGGPDYYTVLDFFFLQDGDIFNYWPPASVSASQMITNFVNSSHHPTIPNREIRIYLPRGYAENTWKQYPVFYMHDGQNVFTPGGGFGSWDADISATREISQGRMREAIIVGVNNTSERMREYIPPGDDPGFGPGTGDLYADFLINNVKPTLDCNYRTLWDKENTFVMGSSLGGLISTYIGWTHSGVFGNIGPMSPSYWAGPNFAATIASGPKRDIWIYTDMGTGNDVSLWANYWIAYDDFLSLGYAVNKDLVQVIGCGHDHSEWAWALRLPGAFQYLLSLWREPNRLALTEYETIISEASYQATPDEFMVSLPGLYGEKHTLQRRANLKVGTWSNLTMTATQQLPWANVELKDTSITSSDERFYYRVQREADHVAPLSCP